MNILITGGTGSFGQAFVKFLLKERLSERICIYSRDEYKQSLMRKDFNDERLRFFIGDVRDRDRLKRAFNGIDLVIHAAALKRIEVGFYDPIEMVRTNVDGSVNVIEASQDAFVKKVVYLSTDKAFEPVSPYGASKALSESLFLSANNITNKTRFSVTRYGNVAGSKGSVIPVWKESKGKVKITDPECTRFYMTMKEAVDLVWKTSLEMPKQIVIPELPAYRLGDLAEALGVETEVVGLPEWEKRHESMRKGLCSKDARRMSVEELRKAVTEL